MLIVAAAVQEPLPPWQETTAGEEETKQIRYIELPLVVDRARNKTQYNINKTIGNVREGLSSLRLPDTQQQLHQQE